MQGRCGVLLVHFVKRCSRSAYIGSPSLQLAGYFNKIGATGQVRICLFHSPPARFCDAELMVAAGVRKM
jgi:hypothetical protein